MKQFLFLLYVLFPLFVQAQSADITIKSVEHDYYQGGEKGMKIHLEVDVYNCKGRKTNVIAFFHKGSNGANGVLYGGREGYRAADGHVCVWVDVVPRYENSTWEDLSLFIPYNAIPHDTETHFSFYAAVRACGSSSNYVKSEWYNFSFNNTSSQQPQSNTIQCSACRGSGSYTNYNPVYGQYVTFTCSMCYGSGRVNTVGGIPVVPQAGGYYGGGGNAGGYSGGNSSGYSGSGASNRDCSRCYGTGKCQTCNGNGYRTDLGVRSGTPCPNCDKPQNGRCAICHGSGKR